MKRLICILVVLGWVSVGWAERNPIYKNWLTPERLERWQGLSQNMNYTNLYTLIEEMYYLEKKPWAEPVKRILLKMTETMMTLQKARAEGKPVILPDHIAQAGPGCQETDSYLDEMVSWQDDPRFIKFQSTFWGGGLASRGLARIGEPAFETVINSFERKPIPLEAVRTLANMMQKEDSFLHRDPVKQLLAQRALIKAVHVDYKPMRLWAVDALRYFPNAEVFTLLETISRGDPWVKNGKYPLRTRAQQALEYLRNH